MGEEVKALTGTRMQRVTGWRSRKSLGWPPADSHQGSTVLQPQRTGFDQQQNVLESRKEHNPPNLDFVSARLKVEDPAEACCTMTPALWN